MCLTLDELTAIKEAYEQSEGELFVGLNRRHAPLIQQIKREMKTDQIPAVYDFIGNAGFIPKDHWYMMKQQVAAGFLARHVTLWI